MCLLFGGFTVVHMELNNHQFLRLPPLVQFFFFLNEATVDLVLTITLEQFENQATNRLLLSMLEECEDSGSLVPSLFFFALPMPVKK